MTAPVLVGFAGGEPSLDALALGGALARATGARILALHVEEADAPYSPYDARHLRTVRERARELRDQLERAAPELAPDVEFSFETLPATTAAAGLHEFVSSERVGLVVTGPTHLNPVGAALLGATGERLLDASPCPVAVAPRGLRNQGPLTLRRIGCGLDGSAESLAGVVSASELARAANAELEVITVVPAGRPWRRSRAGEATAWMEEALADAGVPDAQKAVRSGRPAGELARAAADLDLLVVGSCRRAPLERVLAGSVSEALVRAAEVPVLVVPRGAKPAPMPV